MAAYFPRVRPQSQISHVECIFLISFLGVKADVDETKGKLDETIILKAFNRFTRSSVPMALTVAATNTFKHIRREIVLRNFLSTSFLS